MIMLARRFSFAALAVLAAAPLAIASALERTAAFLIALVPAMPADPAAPRLAAAGPVLAMDGQAFDRSLQNSLRHEAGHRTRSASRGG
ncbi:hypothetical protein vBEliSR6L_99 [Erythrobacter phage vB_EliS_R6L]|nr:hypothetical protein vBEliSR6L_99 [Erythrobacter phage vB_EliS_R6L]